MDTWLIPLARGAHVGGLLLVFGTLTSRLALGVPAAVRRLIWLGFGLAVFAGATWLILEAAEMSWASSLADVLLALPTVATGTRFGRLLLVRLLLLMLAVTCAGRLGNTRRVTLAVALAGIAAGLQAWTGHAAAASDGALSCLAVTETLHLLAAGAWLGALPALLSALPRAAPGQAALMARRFIWLGLPAVLVLAGSGLVQSEQLIGSLPALFGTVYGRIALLKIGLFAALVLLALLNRLSLARRPDALRASIITEIVLGSCVIIAAGLLASSVPGVHELPVWPFPSRPTWQALTDPAAWQGITLGIAGSAAGLLLSGWGLIRRSIGMLSVGIILAVLSLPHLGPLLTEAYPTTFEHAPGGFSTASIVAGADLFAVHCAACHGPGGGGDGPAAAGLPVQPADLRAPHLLAHTEGDLFWFISTGFAAPGGSVAMPGFAPALSEEARWDLVNFLLARNAGARFDPTGTWQPSIRAPNFPIACGNQSMTLDDLRGSLVLLVSAGYVGDDEDARTVWMQPRQGSCAAASSDVTRAYALLIGGPPEAEFVIDAQGWLRAYLPPADAAATRERIDSIRRNPLPEPSMPSGHAH